MSITWVILGHVFGNVTSHPNNNNASYMGKVIVQLLLCCCRCCWLETLIVISVKKFKAVVAVSVLIDVVIKIVALVVVGEL